MKRKVSEIEKARSSIFFNTMIWTLLCSFLFIVLNRFVLHMNLHLWERFTIFFLGQFATVVAVTLMRVKLGEDKDIVFKVMEEKKEKIRLKKEEIIEKRKEIKQNRYRISSISIPKNRCSAFCLHLNQDILNDALPVVYVQGSELVSIQKIGNREILCFPGSVKSDSETVKFECGGEQIKIKNPYYIDNEMRRRLRWQCEGHSYQKNIFLPAGYFPHAEEEIEYNFDLLVNGKWHMRCTGLFYKSMEFIIIAIKNIDKEDCRGKYCFIRPTFDKRIRFNLPEPEVILRENARV